MTCGHGYGMRDHCERCSAIDARARRDFAWAQRALRDGLAVRRRGWTSPDGRLYGRPSFVFAVPAWECPRVAEICRDFGTRGEGFIAQSREDRGGPSPWVPTLDDLDANDWCEWPPPSGVGRLGGSDGQERKQRKHADGHHQESRRALHRVDLRGRWPRGAAAPQQRAALVARLGPPARSRDHGDAQARAGPRALAPSPRSREGPEPCELADEDAKHYPPRRNR